MVERSSPWDGTSVGDAVGVAPYDAATEFGAILKMVSDSYLRTNKGGVCFGEGNSLNPATVGTSPVTVDTGAALVHGTLYENTTSANVAIPTPAGATRIDLIVLRKSWSAQTVRLTRIAGAEGGAAPAMTQTPSVTWDIPIAQASITTGGAITLTDLREHAFGVSVSNPTNIAFDVAASPGAFTTRFASKSDHIHELIDPGTPATLSFNGAGAAGSSNKLAREDHAHEMPSFHRKYKLVDLAGSGSIDANLQFPALAAEKYILEGTIFYDDNGGATNITVTIGSTAGSTSHLSVIGQDSGVVVEKNSYQHGASPSFAMTPGIVHSLQFRATVIVGNAGNIGLILNGSTAPRIRIGSNLTAVEV